MPPVGGYDTRLTTAARTASAACCPTTPPWYADGKMATYAGHDCARMIRLILEPAAKRVEI